MILPFLVLLLISNGSDIQDGDWKLKRDDKEIKVYTRKVDGYVTNEFRAVTTVKASLAHVITLFEDTGRIHEWMYRCKEFKEIEQKGPGEKLFYYRQGLPWPAAERDTVIHRVRTEDPSTKAVSYALTDVPDMFPEQKEVVRMPYLKGLWVFTPKDNERVELQYQLLLDVGGNIPKWLENTQLNISLPYHSLKNFRELIQSSKYQNARDKEILNNI